MASRRSSATAARCPDVIGGDYADGGGGRVLPIPDWMAHDTTRLPDGAGNRAVVRRGLPALG